MEENIQQEPAKEVGKTGIELQKKIGKLTKIIFLLIGLYLVNLFFAWSYLDTLITGISCFIIDCETFYGDELALWMFDLIPLMVLLISIYTFFIIKRNNFNLKKFTKVSIIVGNILLVSINIIFWYFRIFGYDEIIHY